MNLIILSSFLLCFAFVPTQQQGRRAPSSSPSAQSTQQNAGQRRGNSPQSSSGFSRGQPRPEEDKEEDSYSNPESEGGEVKEKKFGCPKSDGLFPDNSDCRRFMLCGNWKAWSQSCPPSLYFDSKLKYCTFKTAQLTCGPVDEEELRLEELERNQDNLPICDRTQCQLPNCFCSEEGISIPGDLEPNQTPQLILINFSGALNQLVYDHYKRVLGYSSKFSTHQTRTNPNGCGIRATFFINHEYSNYAEIQWLATQGHEIAMHSITHRLPEIWWTDNANYSDWAEEIIGMREIILANSAGSVSTPVLSRENLVGMRAPYIKPGGDGMFEMAHDFGLLYDSSLVAPTASKSSLPFWPFTFDYRQPFDCSNNKKSTPEVKKSADGDDILSTNIRQNRPRQKRNTNNVKFDKKNTTVEFKKSPKLNAKSRVRRNSFLGRPLKCPTKAYPALWEIPINPLFNNDLNVCHHADQCVFPNSGDDDDIEIIFEFLRDNFERHYNSNRAPFQLNFHVTWFTQKGHVKALNKFFDYLETLKDVWFVTFQQLISWMKDPKSITETNFKCENKTTLTTCNRPHTCVVKHYLNKDNNAATEEEFSKVDTRYMPVCHSSVCPQQYQWFGNYAGKKKDFKTIMQLVEDAVGPDQSSGQN